ncbi:MAG: hypothetical protein ABIP94_20220 [Planctomycetota bacterium]
MAAPDVRTPGGPGLADADSKTDAAIIGDLAQHYKSLATLKARFALRAFELHELGDGSLLCRCSGLVSKPLKDLDAAWQFARLVGAA